MRIMVRAKLLETVTVLVCAMVVSLLTCATFLFAGFMSCGQIVKHAFMDLLLIGLAI
jgi:hypothetical protein